MSKIVSWVEFIIDRSSSWSKCRELQWAYLNFFCVTDSMNTIPLKRVKESYADNAMQNNSICLSITHKNKNHYDRPRVKQICILYWWYRFSLFNSAKVQTLYAMKTMLSFNIFIHGKKKEKVLSFRFHSKLSIRCHVDMNNSIFYSDGYTFSSEPYSFSYLISAIKYTLNIIPIWDHQRQFFSNPFVKLFLLSVPNISNCMINYTCLFLKSRIYLKDKAWGGSN